jgi:predicted enzyme related to lactoylglutathione lyase
MADPVVHFELTGVDREALGRFYGELFGWHVESVPEPPYAVIDTHGGAGINGGIGSVDDPDAKYVALYAQTQDINATFDRAVSMGAEVLLDVNEVPGVITLALLRDPQGNTFGLVGAGEGGGQGHSAGDGAPVDWFEILGPEPKVLRDFYLELFGWEPFGEDARASRGARRWDDHGAAVDGAHRVRAAPRPRGERLRPVPADLSRFEPGSSRRMVAVSSVLLQHGRHGRKEVVQLA